MWTHLCRSHIRLRNRPHPCRTRRIIPVRTSPRACPTLCGSSAPLCWLHRPGNSRSHPGPSVCTAASRRTAPRCICPGSSPRTWHWRPTPRRLALEVRTTQWWGGETSLDAGRRACWRLVLMCGLGERQRERRGLPLGDLSGVTYGSSGCMVISNGQLCFAHDLPSSISSFRCCRPSFLFFLSVRPLFRDPAWKWDLLWTAIQELKSVWPDVISYLWFVYFFCVLVSDGAPPPKPPTASCLVVALKD